MELQLAAAMASIGDGVIITSLDSNILFMNETAQQLTGWQGDAALGRQLAEVFVVINAQTRELVESPFLRAVNGGVPVGLLNYSALVSRGGAQMYISANIAPVKSNAGGIQGVVVVFRDITRIKIMEEQLSEEQRKLKAIFNAAPVGMIIVNETTLIEQVNASFLHLFGLNEGEVNRGIGNSLQCVNSFADERGCGYGAACQACLFRQAIVGVLQTGQKVADLELCFSRTVDGQDCYPWFRINIIPMLISNDKHVVIVFDDISKYKELEEKLVKSRDFYLTLFENFPALMWRAGVDKKYDYFNRNWLEFTGRKLEQELGNGWAGGVHPNDFDYCFQTFIECFDRRKPFEMEYRLRRHDGVYRWVLDIGKPFIGLDGKFGGYIGAVYDITERKIAEEGLKRYELLSETAKDIIVFADNGGNIIDANEAAVDAYGYTLDEMLTKTLFDVVDQAKHPYLDQWLQSASPSQGLLIETVNRRKDGSLFPVEVSAQPAVIGGRSINLGIIRDISERKKAEQVLKETADAAHIAYRAKSEFLANMSHEIRTPLNGVIGMIDLTLMSGLSREQQENLSIAKTCADSLLNVINDILEFSKMEAGKVILEKVAFDIRDIVEKTVKVHAVHACAKGLALNYQLAADLPTTLIGDAFRLQQVLNNLLSNAIKFTETGKVDISVKPLSANGVIKLMFAVFDTGIGISPGEKGRLFKSFSQLDSSHTRKYGGTGLGLVISKQLVEMMGGEIWVESAKDQGSVFYFTITCESGSCETGESAPMVIIPPTHPGKQTRLPRAVLLAEDHKLNQTVTGSMLAKMGHTFAVAENGLVVLNMLQQQHFDLILMDIQMPEMDGLEATAVIRRQEEGTARHIPIIALTAHALHGDRERFLALGMDDYIAKPVQFNDLFDVIESAGSNAATVPNELDLMLESICNAGETSAKSMGHGQQIDLILDEIEKEISDVKAAAAAKDAAAIERGATKIKMLAAKNSLESIKNLAFRIALDVRRGSVNEADRLVGEIEKDLANLKMVTKGRL